MANNQVNIRCLNEAELVVLATRFARRLPDGPILIFLRGDLGAGKSTFARAFLRAAGVDGRIKSPTYTLIEPYRVGDRRFFRLDLYRLADPEELEYLAFRDLLVGDSVLLIEWPEKAAGALPGFDLEVHLKMVDALQREVRLNPASEAGSRLMKSL